MTHIELQKMRLGDPDASGRCAPVACQGETCQVEADLAIVAVGTGANPLITQTTPGLETYRRGYIVAAPGSGETSIRGVYAGGDIVTGAATVISAMESAQAELKAAHSNREQGTSDEKRYAILLSKQVVSQSEYDLKHLAADEARARAERADRALKLAISQLEYAKLLSSTDGVVTKTSAEAGQVVPQGQSVVTVARKGALEVLADIPERGIQGIKHTKAEMSLWAKRDARYQAVLRETSPSADPATRTYTVRYSLPNADASVRLGMLAQFSSVVLRQTG